MSDVNQLRVERNRRSMSVTENVITLRGAAPNPSYLRDLIANFANVQLRDVIRDSGQGGLLDFTLNLTVRQ